MKLVPLFDRIFIRPIERDRRTKGGLHIPEIAIDGTPYQFGEVMAVGDGRYTDAGVLIPPRVKAGDVVMWWRDNNSGNQIIIPGPDGEEWWMIREMFCCGLATELASYSPIVDTEGRALVQ